jgi:phage shock protein C
VNPRRLYRSRDRQLAGVAGGMAEYLDIDPTVVRILWIVVGIASGGLVLLAYFILALVIPQAPYAAVPGAPAGWATEGSPGGWSAAPGTSNGWTPPAAPAWGVDPTVNAAAAPAAVPQAQGRGIGAAAIVGVVLIVVGVIALADALLPGWVSGAILGPALILALGAALLVSSIRRTADDAPAAASSQSNELGVSGPATEWDVTDTQSVAPAAVDATTGTTIESSDEAGTIPA